MSSINYIDLYLSAQRALLGEVIPSLRGVAVEIKNNQIIIYFYNDGIISKELANDFRCIGSEIASDFSEEVEVEERIVNLNYPELLPNHGPHWVYKRKEKFLDSAVI